MLAKKGLALLPCCWDFYKQEKFMKQAKPPTIKDYLQAFLDYLRRPKTVFDIKDRAKGLLLMLALIIVLQKVVQLLAD